MASSTSSTFFSSSAGASASASATASSVDDAKAAIHASHSFADCILNKQIDFGKRSEDYARHRPGFPDSFYRRVHQLWSCVTRIQQQRQQLSARSYQTGGAPFLLDFFAASANNALSTSTAASNDDAFTILDLGSGPGIIGLRMAQMFPQATVFGVDVSKDQIEMAKVKAGELGLQNRTFWSVGAAEQTRLPSASCDIVVAGQCWHWFNHALAMQEIKRLLKPGGLLVIGQLCYLPRRSKLAADTEQLILKHNPGWKFADWDGVAPGQIDQLVLEGGFNLVEQFCTDVNYPFSHEGWRGRMRTCNGVGSGTLSEATVEEFDRELQKLLTERYPDQPVGVYHRIWSVAVTLRTPEDE